MRNLKINNNQEALVLSKANFTKIWNLLKSAPESKVRDKLMDEIQQQTGIFTALDF